MREVLKLSPSYIASCVAYYSSTINCSGRSVAGAGAGLYPDRQDLREAIEQDIRSLINRSVCTVCVEEWARIWSL